MVPDLDSAIANTAAAPKTVQTDAGSVTSQNVADIIAADQYLAAKKAAASGSPLNTALRFASPRLPGLP